MNKQLEFNGIYRGKVLATDGDETDKLGRIKVEVYPMLVGEVTARQLKADDARVDIEGIATSNLPWAVPAMPLFSGAGDDFGTFAVPEIGSFVFVFFEGGDVYQPVYFAEAQTKTMGLPSGRLTNYPSRRIIRMSSGIEIILDNETGDITITSPGDVIVQGATVSINP